jgi:hypothetical protein
MLHIKYDKDTSNLYNWMLQLFAYSFIIVLSFYCSRLDNVIMRLNDDVLIYDWKQGPPVQQSSPIQDSASQQIVTTQTIEFL